MPSFPDEEIDLGRWKKLIAKTAALKPVSKLQGTDPFTKQPLDIPAPNSARVMEGGKPAGNLWWDGRGIILVDGDDSATIAMAFEIAEALGAEFVDDEGSPYPAD